MESSLAVFFFPSHFCLIVFQVGNGLIVRYMKNFTILKPISKNPPKKKKQSISQLFIGVNMNFWPRLFVSSQPIYASTECSDWITLMFVEKQFYS